MNDIPWCFFIGVLAQSRDRPTDGWTIERLTFDSFQRAVHVELRLHPIRDGVTKERLFVVWSLIDRGWWRGRSLLPLYDVSCLLKYRFHELSKHVRLDREVSIQSRMGKSTNQ